jgi:hypothetical protein
MGGSLPVKASYNVRGVVIHLEDSPKVHTLWDESISTKGGS